MMRRILALLALLVGTQAYAAGTLNIALTQQFSFTGCSSSANVCGTPLSGGLLYFYQVGTASTRQDSFQDTALSIANPWPLVLDANGRVPMFYLADGSIHVRLTDAGGVVQFDYPAMLVIGPSGTGTSTAVNPSTESTGDIKFRMEAATATSFWIPLNGKKIGPPGSAGADLTGATYQALYNYLWVNCNIGTGNTHCAVAGGKGATAVADWNAGKNLQLPDFRGRAPFGLDDMGNTRANVISDALNMAAPDIGTTPGGLGGQATHVQAQAEMATHAHAVSTSVSVSVSGGISGGTSATHTHNVPVVIAGGSFGTVGMAEGNNVGPTNVGLPTGGESVSGSFSGSGSGSGSGATDNRGSSSPFNVMAPFILGSWYIRL